MEPGDPGKQQTANPASSTSKPQQPASRQTNLQRIQLKKQAVLAFPYNKKLLKLAIYSKCQVLLMSAVKMPLFFLLILFFCRLKSAIAQDGVGQRGPCSKNQPLLMLVDVNIC